MQQKTDMLKYSRYGTNVTYGHPKSVASCKGESFMKEAIAELATLRRRDTQLYTGKRILMTVPM